MLVAKPAVASNADRETLVRSHIDDQIAGKVVKNQRSGRHADEAIAPVRSETLLLATRAAVLGRPFGATAKVQQRVKAVLGFKGDIATTTAIAAAGAALRLVFAATKRNMPCTAVPGLDCNYGLVYKHSA